MSAFRSDSRTATKSLLVADVLIALTVLGFGIAAWTMPLSLASKVLASVFAVGILAFAVPDAVREVRKLAASDQRQRPLS